MSLKDDKLIEYQGQPLQPGNTYFWRVRVWDQRGKASRRIRGRWFSGLMEPARWGEARWIGAPWQGDTVTAGHFPAPEFQRTLSVRRGLKSATAWVCGLGWCEFAVNGRVVSAPLAPAFTDYTAREGLEKRYIGLEPHFAGYRVLYNRYDIVTRMLVENTQLSVYVFGSQERGHSEGHVQFLRAGIDGQELLKVLVGKKHVERN